MRRSEVQGERQMIDRSHRKFMSRITTRIKRLAKAELKNRWLQSAIIPDTVLYESFGGNGMTCSPEALFRHILDQPDLATLRHIWVLNDFKRYRVVIDEFSDHSNVQFVLYGSLAYYKALATSQYLINNVTFPTQFVKREGQTYVNTWHGVPLKKMGYDISGRAVDSRNVIRNFLATDYLLSSSPAMTNRMYISAYKLSNVFNGAIIEEGSPRTDRQHSLESARRELGSSLMNTGIDLEDKKVILYAPTWKGESYFSPHNDAANLLALVKHLESRIDTSKFQVLIKAHQVISEGMSSDSDLSPYLIPNSVPTNVVLGAAALLITDYSSIFYDFLSLGRPIVFYVPDLSEYRTYRDLYMEPESFPGEVAENLDQLAQIVSDTVISSNSDPKIQERYASQRQQFAAKDDGDVSSRIVDVVFRRKESGKAIRRNLRDGRYRVLIYAGGMAPNGITTSALNLLDNINYDRYDVTVLCPLSDDPAKKRSFEQVNPNARLMFRSGTFNAGYLQQVIRQRVLAKGLDSYGARFASQRRLWAMEWKRCFGDSSFDHMVDFSGYTAFWGMLFLNGPEAKRSIWLHNDLAADALRSINGNTPLRDGLFSTFSLYKNFNNLVSVSKGLQKINQDSLSVWAKKAQFASSSNTINAAKILQMSAFDGEESRRAFDAKIPQSDIRKSNSDRLGRLVYELLTEGTEAATTASTESLSKRSNEYFTFISVGRLSPEKNHARLINAFARVHEDHPLTRLIIAGEGPLRSDLEELIGSKGLHSAIKLVGHTRNPYKVMALSDIFVLSSDYEGQPMVLLEALVLGLPVITTSFGSVAGALPHGVGTIVVPSVDALASAMRNAVERPSEVVPFDSDAYNERAVKEFESILGH